MEKYKVYKVSHDSQDSNRVVVEQLFKLARKIIYMILQKYTLIDEYVTRAKAGEEQQDLSDCVIAYDLSSGQQRKMILAAKKAAMIFWNKGQLMAGWFEQGEVNTNLILHSVASKDTKADLRIELPIEWARLS